MPNIRKTTTKDGKTVLICEFRTYPPPSTGQKRKEANKTALLPAQLPSKTPNPSSANQPNLVDHNYSKVVSCVEDVEDNIKELEVGKISDDSRRDGAKPAAVSKNAGGENLAPDEAVAERSKGAEVVEEKKKAGLCCCDNCSKKATIWPFQNAQRAGRRLLGYCKKCDNAREKAQNSKKVK